MKQRISEAVRNRGNSPNRKPRCGAKPTQRAAPRARTRVVAASSVLVACLGALWWWAAGTKSGPTRGAGGPSPTESPPTTLAQLLAASSERNSLCDVAQMNLLCAEGLPGAEHLDVSVCLENMDRWTERVKSETERHLYRFRNNPGDYEDSEGYFRMLMMSLVLYEDFNVRYNPARISSPENLVPA